MTTAQIGDSGIVLNGGPDGEGVVWRWLVGSDPWQAPEPRDESGDNSFAHGTWNGTEFYGPRMQDLAVRVQAPSHAALHEAHDRWKAAVGLHDFQLTIAEPHVTRWGLMRRRGSMPWTEDTSGGSGGRAKASTSVSLQGDDPLIYGLEQRTASTGYPSTVGGLSWPAQWPATWDAEVESGLLQLDNAGNEPAEVLWRIDGPVSRPRIIDTITNDWFALDLDLAAGEWVTVDSATRQVLMLGQQGASRRPLWSGKWLTVPKGGRLFAFAGAAGSAPASATASWWPTWI